MCSPLLGYFSFLFCFDYYFLLCANVSHLELAETTCHLTTREPIFTKSPRIPTKKNIRSLGEETCICGWLLTWISIDATDHERQCILLTGGDGFIDKVMLLYISCGGSLISVCRLWYGIAGCLVWGGSGLQDRQQINYTRSCVHGLILDVQLLRINKLIALLAFDVGLVVYFTFCFMLILLNFSFFLSEYLLNLPRYLFDCLCCLH